MLRLPGCSWGKVCRCTFIRTIYTILYSISFHWSHFLGRAEERVAKLVDSPDRPESEASYKLDEGGWADVWTFLINDTLLRSFVFFKILSLLSLSLERALTVWLPWRLWLLTIFPRSSLQCLCSCHEVMPVFTNNLCLHKKTVAFYWILILLFDFNLQLSPHLMIEIQSELHTRTSNDKN